MAPPPPHPSSRPEGIGALFGHACRSSGGLDMAPHTLVDPGHPSALLLCGWLGAEVVVVGHPPADVGVEVPLDRARGEGLLRLDDLLEERVVGGLLVSHLYVDLELLLQHRGAVLV